MKIAFIGQKGIPVLYGGVERHVDLLATALAEHGHDVRVYCRSYYTPKVLTKYLGVKLIHLPSLVTKHLDAITHTFISTIHALRSDAEIIHYHGVGPALLAFIPRLFKPTVKVVVTFHSLDREHAKWNSFAKKILTLGEWAACVFPHQTIVISKGLQDYALSKYRTQTVYLANCIRLTDFTGQGNISCLQTFGLQPKKYFIIVSRLIPHKNIEEAIFAFIKANLEGYKLVVVGDGFFTDEYVDFLHGLSEEFPQIVFTGSQQGESLKALFSQSLASFLPSRNEGLSFSMLESLGYGLPLIVRNNPENEEFCKDKVVNYYEEKEELVSIFKEIVSDPEKYKKQGEFGKEYVTKHFALEVVVKQTEELYQGLIKQK